MRRLLPAIFVAMLCVLAVSQVAGLPGRTKSKVKESTQILVWLPQQGEAPIIMLSQRSPHASIASLQTGFDGLHDLSSDDVAEAYSVDFQDTVARAYLVEDVLLSSIDAFEGDSVFYTATVKYPMAGGPGDTVTETFTGRVELNYTNTDTKSRDAIESWEISLGLAANGDSVIVKNEYTSDWECRIRLDLLYDDSWDYWDVARAIQAGVDSTVTAESHSDSFKTTIPGWEGGEIYAFLRVYGNDGTHYQTLLDTLTLDAPGQLYTMVGLSNHAGWNTAAVADGMLPARTDTGLAAGIFDICVRDSLGAEFQVMRVIGAAATTVLDCRTNMTGYSGLAPYNANRIINYRWSALDSIPVGAEVNFAGVVLSPDSSYGDPIVPLAATDSTIAEYHHLLLDIWGNDNWVDAPAYPSYGVWARNVTWSHKDSTTETVWSPTLDQRTGMSQGSWYTNAAWHALGVPSDTSRTALCGKAQTVFEEEGWGVNYHLYDVTKAVQTFVDLKPGTTNFPIENNGFWLGWRRGAGGNDSYVMAGLNDVNDCPVFVARYTVGGQYTEPSWNGKPLAFSWGTDDQVADHNREIYAVFDTLGTHMPISLCVRGDKVRSESAGSLLAEDILEAVNTDSFVFVQHSDVHSGLGVIDWGDSSTMHREISRGWCDSLIFWDECGDTCGGDDPRFPIDVHAYANGTANLYSPMRLQEYGYKWARLAGGGEFYCADAGTAGTEDLGRATFMSLRDPTNVYAVAILSASLFVHYNPPEAQPDSATIALNAWKGLMHCLAEGQAAMISFSHDDKSGIIYDTSTIDMDEAEDLVGAILYYDLCSFGTYSQVYDWFADDTEFVRPIEVPTAHSAYDSMYVVDGDGDSDYNPWARMWRVPLRSQVIEWVAGTVDGLAE